MRIGPLNFNPFEAVSRHQSTGAVVKYSPDGLSKVKGIASQKNDEDLLRNKNKAAIGRHHREVVAQIRERNRSDAEGLFKNRTSNKQNQQAQRVNLNASESSLKAQNNGFSPNPAGSQQKQAAIINLHKAPAKKAS